MKNRHFYFFFVLFLAVAFFFFSPILSFAENDLLNVNLTVDFSCNNNGECAGNETRDNCPNDCKRTSQGNKPNPVRGCTDPEAVNYNPNADIDDDSCQYSAVPNVSNFSASVNGQDISLSWNNPSNSAGFTFSAVRIVRRTGFFPSGPNDGALIYDSSGENATDSGLSPGTYYYAAYARNSRGEYSSGAVTLGIISPAEKEDEDEKRCEGENCEEDNRGEDPFENFPLVDAKLKQLCGYFCPFKFLQKGKIINFSGIEVPVNGDTELTILTSYDTLPEVLKTIGVTIFDQTDKKKSYSFVLRVDDKKKAYAAVISPFLKTGRYPIAIHVFDYKNQRISRLKGVLVVRASFVKIMWAVIKKTAAPVAITAGMGAGAAEGLFFASKVNSLYDAYLILIRFLGTIFGAVGLKKRRLPWGTVYDSATKRPLDPAYVSALRWGKEYRSAITDLDGRYGFLLPPGIYSLEAKKTHYKFPSQKLSGRGRDEMYDNLYFSGEITVGEGELISRNIPMDPIHFDWNEFAKDKSGYIKFHSRRELVRARIFNGVYVLGFITACLTLIFSPSFFNIGVIVIYLSIVAASVLWRRKHKVVQVKNKISGEPIPFAIVRFFMAGVNEEIKSVVTDELGRFYQLLRPGDYYLTVEERQEGDTYKKIHQSETLHLSSGIIQSDIVIMPSETI